jgi:hypothetical protein
LYVVVWVVEVIEHWASGNSRGLTGKELVSHDVDRPKRARFPNLVGYVIISL